MMITFSEYVVNNVQTINFSKTFKQLLKLPDSYEKMRLLDKKIRAYNKDKTKFIYRLAVNEYKRLKRLEKKLLAEKKRRLAKKWKDDSFIPSDKNVNLKLTVDDLAKLTNALYLSYVDTKKFIRLCKGMKKILPNFLSSFKANGDKHMYKKYYSVYIDVCEYLSNNFSETNKQKQE